MLDSCPNSAAECDSSIVSTQAKTHSLTRIVRVLQRTFVIWQRRREETHVVTCRWGSCADPASCATTYVTEAQPWGRLFLRSCVYILMPFLRPANLLESSSIFVELLVLAIALFETREVAGCSTTPRQYLTHREQLQDEVASSSNCHRAHRELLRPGAKLTVSPISHDPNLHSQQRPTQI